MKHAYIFPGQGAQFPGMGKQLFNENNAAKAIFEEADDILSFAISKIMFEGTEEEL
ncbi:MAG: ACP S-malonyltransferase, partial [Chitinophagaceae bacterium]